MARTEVVERGASTLSKAMEVIAEIEQDREFDSHCHMREAQTGGYYLELTNGNYYFIKFQPEGGIE